MFKQSCREISTDRLTPKKCLKVHSFESALLRISKAQASDRDDRCSVDPKFDFAYIPTPQEIVPMETGGSLRKKRDLPSSTPTALSFTRIAILIHRPTGMKKAPRPTENPKSGFSSERGGTFDRRFLFSAVNGR